MHIKSIVSVLLSGKYMLKCQLENEIKHYLGIWLIKVQHGSRRNAYMYIHVSFRQDCANTYYAMWKKVMPFFIYTCSRKALTLSPEQQQGALWVWVPKHHAASSGEDAGVFANKREGTSILLVQSQAKPQGGGFP